MQDSIEDYIRISRNAKQEESIKINKDSQLITAQKRKECNMRAVKIVEFSIEGKLRPEIFTKCLPFIEQSHYQDIVEERAILKLCGYPVCGERLPEMPKKQYYISTKSNKIYDITERKNYCSNFCYKASIHIKKQIDDTPIWLRTPDVIPEYQLLAPTEKGLPGEYIDQGIVKPEIEPAFTSVSVFAEVSLKDIVANEKGNEKLNKGKGTYKKSSKHLKSTMQTITENSEQLEEEEEDVTDKAKIPTRSTSKKINKKHEHAAVIKILPVIDENEEKPDIIENIKVNSESSKTVSKKTRRKSGKAQKIEIESSIQKAIKEWLTLDSYIFIHGEYKVKEILNEKKLSDYFEELKITELQRDQQIKYMNICKRLQLQEMADEKFDNALIGNTKLKPMPDYRKLKEETKDLNIKVKCFYSGVLHKKEDSNFPTQINKKSDESTETEVQGVLPLVDVNSQNAMRRKIFLTSINKSMQQLLQSLRVTHFSSVLSDVQTLVKTFHLKADNIVFKPILWNYIAIVLLNILSLRDKNIKAILEEKQSEAIIELQLNALPSKMKFIDDIMTNIQNIDVFVENYISTK